MATQSSLSTRNTPCQAILSASPCNPQGTWKSVTDAWNGHHSVPIHEVDCHLTTFITLWGRFHYRVVPHRFKASGDGYTRHFDEIIQDILRITKCVDDSALCDESLEGHWWRMIDFIELLGHHGIVLNTNKVSVCPNRSTIC